MKAHTKQMVDALVAMEPRALRRHMFAVKARLAMVQQELDAALKAIKQQKRKQRESGRDPATGG